VGQARAVIGLTLVSVVAGAASPAFDLAQIQARGKLRVIAAEGEQPEEFAFQAQGRHGFEREMLEGFATLHHLGFEVVKVKTWDDRIPALLRGDGDVIVALTDTEARRKQIAFTTETLPARHLVVTAGSRPPVNTLDELRALAHVGVVKATSWAEAAREAGVSSAHLEEFDELDALLGALRAGAIDATVMSVSDYTLAAKRHPGLKAGLFVGPPRHQAWGVRKEDTELLKAMDDYISNLRRTPSWSRLIVGYFGEESLKVLGRAREQ